MKRKIKFRVWNGVEYIGKIGPGQAPEPNDYGFFDDLEFEEWTGLTDKNGVEIFEGDIIKFNRIPFNVSSESVGLVCWNEKNARFLIASISGLPSTVSDALPLYEIDKVNTWEYVVIGNVHQNPELLQKS